MASNTYTTGNTTYRRKKQGAPQKPAEIKRSETIITHTTMTRKNKFLEMQRESGMSQSAFGDLVIANGLMKLSESNNC